jgi:hypothetical protein
MKTIYFKSALIMKPLSFWRRVKSSVNLYLLFFVLLSTSCINEVFKLDPDDNQDGFVPRTNTHLSSENVEGLKRDSLNQSWNFERAERIARRDSLAMRPRRSR